jgi:hypothetical protein
MILLIILGSVIVVTIIIYAIWYFNRKRAKTLRLVAESLNFTFSEKGDKPLMDSLSGFDLFSRGYGRRISNVLSGKFNLLPVTVMGYQYTMGGGISTSILHQTVLFIESEKLNLPRFTLHPEDIFDKIASAFGKEGLNFETAPLFSKQYLLNGDNETSIRSLFNASVLDYYEQHRGVSTEGDGVKLIYYRFFHSVSPDNIQDFLRQGYDVFDLFKIR